MKKNFLKKLSFVMALAMIISIIAPAAGAFASTALKLNATSKVLFLGENETYNFDVLNGAKGQTHKWTSSNTAVATVGVKTGVVTAKAVGKTTIKVVVSNAKGVVKTLSATVNVGDNMEEIKIVAPTGVDVTKLEAGTDYDFNRNFVTMSGSETKTSNITVWSLDKEGAKISTTGVFHATKTDDFTITARAFRSKAHYKAWVAAGSDENSEYIINEDSVDVKVYNSIKEVKQVGTSTFNVVFGGEVGTSLSKDTVSVAQIVNGTDVTTGAEKIKSITVDSTGTVATIELFADFVAKATYKFMYEELEGTFTAASKDAKDVTSIVFDDFNVDVSRGGSSNLVDYISAVNADGIKILTGSDISSFVTFEVTSDQSKGFVDSANQIAYIYTVGNTVTVKATFTNYVYNETSNKYETVTFSDTAVGTGVTADVNTSTMQYALVATPATGTSSHPSSISLDWISDEKDIALGDGSYDIYTRYKNTTDSSTARYTYTTISSTTFKYVSSDPSKLSVFGNTLTPLASGTVAVIVKNSDGTKVLGSFDVKINAERMLASATPNVGSVTVGNHNLYGEVKEVVIAIKDNLGKNMKKEQVTASTPELLSKPANAAPLNIQAPTVDDGEVKIKLNARNAVTGLYRYKVGISDVISTGTVTKEVVFEVNVAESNTAVGNANVPVNYIALFEVSYTTFPYFVLPASEASSFDYLAALLPSGVKITHQVYGVNSSGYRVAKYSYGTDYLAEVKLNGVVVTTGSALDIVTFHPSGISGVMSTVKLQPIGSYQLSVTSVSGGAIQRPAGSTFTNAVFDLANSLYVRDHKVKAFSVKQSTHSTIKEVLKDALELSVSSVLGSYSEIDFDTISAADIDIRGINSTDTPVSINLNDPVYAGKNLYIDTITVRIPGTSSSVVKSEFTFDVKQSIAIK